MPESVTVGEGPAQFSFTAELWEHQGDAAWYFMSLPESVADEVAEIVDLGPGGRRGFGSVRVEVTVGATTWRTSVFPDSKRGTYLLPVKAAVRRAEGLDVGTVAALSLRLVD